MERVLLGRFGGFGVILYLDARFPVRGQLGLLLRVMNVPNYALSAFALRDHTFDLI